MKTQDIFNQYTPSLIPKSNFNQAALTTEVDSGNILICGEVHGVIEDADILYSLFTHFGFEVLGLERTKEEFEGFINSLLPGSQPNFDLIDDDVFIASVLSPQFAKTISILFSEGKLRKIEYIDSDDEDRENGIANNILKLARDQKTLCVLGNWHTAIGVKGHKSALENVREVLPNTPCLEYEYCSGQYYNIANGLDDFEDNRKDHTKYSVKINSPKDYTLFIPKATPVTN